MIAEQLTMNKPPIKQKPTIKPKPPVKPLKPDLKSFESDEQVTKVNEDDLQHDLKFDEFTESTVLNLVKDKSYQKVEKDQLIKAFQLLNQNNLPEQESQYDIRVDEDQIETCNQIINILFEAGYLRANIVGLSEFDKIIGGMCWCIELCNIDIDIDLFYQDSLIIGQKIALTEKIVKVLHIMKCPHQIEAHQIQGLDCINILPVVKWLIKESHEFGIHIKDYIDMFAAYKYDCDHGLNKIKEDILVISRTKEVKKIIKEYFNKNEIRIDLELKVKAFTSDLESAVKFDQQLVKSDEETENEIRFKEQDIVRIDEECTKLTEQLIEHQTVEKKQLALDYSKLVDELKIKKTTNKLAKSKMKKEYETLLNSANFETDGDLLYQLDLEKSKLNNFKLQLAEKNKKYLVLRRKHDNILSKEEMSQYQKRFIELSAQVSNKHNETKKFYILYNQLDSTKKQLENKFLFFESLLKCYNQLNPSINCTMNQQFIAQLEQKIKSLNSTLIPLQARNRSDSQRRQALEKQNVELIEMKRLYHRYVKELKEEMMKGVK